MAPATSGACAVCLAPATQCCSSCRATFYCHRDHQRQHWKAHKAECAPYRVEADEALGRHLVAARDIRAGEVILREAPLVVGPKVASYPACLGCLRRVRAQHGAYRECSGCGWPVCGPACEALPWHADECRLMRARGHRAALPCPPGAPRKEAAYCSIAPLRCLLLKTSDPARHAELMALQSHYERRRDTSLYNLLKTSLVGFLRGDLGLEEFPAEEILRVAAILDTNAFEVRREAGAVDARAVFPRASLLAHDCRPNTEHAVVGPGFHLVLAATVPIARGQVISTSYTRVLWGTLTRRAHLRAARCFDCACARCADPSELGSYLGSISCAACKPRDSRLVSADPLDAAAPWRCTACPHSVPGRRMAWGNDAMRQELDAVDRASPAGMEDFLGKYEGALHPGNYHVVELKYSLLLAYGNVDGYLLQDLSDEQLDRKLDLCHELLDIADLLRPGLSRLRGTLLYEMQAAMVLRAKRDFEHDRITKSEAQDVMGEAMALLQSAADILRSDPDMEAQLRERLAALAASLDDT
ncbi:SET domain-containing protein SmydA-8 [Bacillus rossius redtenbacheri]|uniref:SET domain-containing protein SmydA-8 n=1 Tax=Bacillus rossius redtenbacheri TaxID=93214 RepID=UPI002FDD87C4